MTCSLALHPSIDPAYRRVDLFHKEKKQVFTYAEEKGTGDLYWDEHPLITSIKSFEVLIAVPFYTLGMVAWNLAKFPVELRTPQKAFKHLRIALLSPLFCLKIQLAVLRNLFNPHQIRKEVAALEYEWHDRISYKEDFRMNCKTDFFKSLVESRVCYLAWCFQKRGNVRDLHFKRL